MNDRKEMGAMPEQLKAEHVVACCGLYCGSCRRFKKGACPGCRENTKAGWCKVRRCCLEHGWSSCAQCKVHADPRDCRLFNNAIARLMGFLFNSDRRACILQIREVGLETYASRMAESGRMSLPR